MNNQMVQNIVVQLQFSLQPKLLPGSNCCHRRHWLLSC